MQFRTWLYYLSLWGLLFTPASAQPNVKARELERATELARQLEAAYQNNSIAPRMVWEKRQAALQPLVEKPYNFPIVQKTLTFVLHREKDEALLALAVQAITSTEVLAQELIDDYRRGNIIETPQNWSFRSVAVEELGRRNEDLPIVSAALLKVIRNEKIETTAQKAVRALAAIQSTQPEVISVLKENLLQNLRDLDRYSAEKIPVVRENASETGSEPPEFTIPKARQRAYSQAIEYAYSLARTKNLDSESIELLRGFVTRYPEKIPERLKEIVALHETLRMDRAP